RSQEIWTLEKCIEYAWANNLSVKQQNIEVSRAENQLTQDKLDFIPSLNASLGHNLNWGRSVDLQNLEIIHNKLSQSTSASVNSSVYLLDGLSRIYGLKSSRKSLEISLQEVERLKDEISVSIVQSYLQILLSREILTAARESFRSMSEQRDRTALLVEAGSQPYSSLLELESQLASERVQVVTARNQVTTSTLALQQLLDLPYDKDFRIAVPDINLTIGTYTMDSPDDIYASAQSMPVIQSARLALDKGDLDLKSAQGQYWPKISLSASYGTFYSSSSFAPDGSTYPFFEQFRDNINPSVSIGLSIPIFNNWNVRTSVRNARLSRRSLEIDLRLKQQNLYKEIQTAVTEADTYYRQMEAAQANVASMEESFRYVEEKFNAGALNGTDYTVARTNLFKARSEYIQAKYQFVFQLKIIDYYKGIPFTL
ncbi:MAG TPA: TolC family protein, partial [Candidatus Coprenecus merdigallinarum]|nr:TolC family protein [Candidatus Coprenecus merdigallinarum]